MTEPLPSDPNLDKIGVRSIPAVGVRDDHRREQAHYSQYARVIKCRRVQSSTKQYWMKGMLCQGRAYCRSV
eukprot:1376931-Pleurochrysis_carterae.AAC.1